MKTAETIHDKFLKDKLKTRCINYADDINNLVENLADIKPILETYNNFARISGLEINLQKTSIVSNRELINDEIQELKQLGIKQENITSILKYLGHTTNIHRSIDDNKKTEDIAKIIENKIEKTTRRL